MGALGNPNLYDAPYHPILEQVDSYDVAGFSYEASDAPYGIVLLTLHKPGDSVTLRFEGVRELEVDAGFPHSSMGLEIRDVSYLGWEEVLIRVQGVVEDPAPALRFWAKKVARVAA